jgi:hypothetical protein
MRIAILISGHIRNSLENDYLITFINLFREAFYKCDIFMHTWDTYEVTTCNPLHVNYDKKLQQKKVDKKDIIKYLNPTKLIVEQQDPSKIYGYKNKCFKVHTSYLSMKFIYYALLKAYSLSRIECIESKTDYDIIIKVRPDIYKFPYLLKEENIKPIIKYIKTHDISQKITGFLHVPGNSLSDNFYFLKYDDGEKFFNNMYYGYDRMCDIYTKRLMPEAIMKICTRELCLKRTVIPNIIASIKDTVLFASKNKVFNVSYYNLIKKKN